MPVKTIGRFTIISELGRGAQGVVYLARDAQLERQVAIKALRPGRNQQTDKLIREARISSNLQHPNIVTLYDVSEHEGMPYLVYAYVKGLTLAQLIQQEGTLPLTQAVKIACGVLEALVHANAHGVMHLDIKPANIMINDSGQPLVMDFGIARMISQQHDASDEILGTPQYMAPESISTRGPEFRSDLFSVGMILYEMVTGRPAVEGENIYQILHRNANERAAPPSSRNPDVDEKLDSIILRAIAKQPEDRYPDAAAMLQVLMQYLEEHSAVAGEGGSHTTLEFLMRRMRSKSDFPALSNAISEINKIASSESVSTSNLTQAILQDFALTNKILKMVNTVSYGQFGGTIHTVSKAVSILGFETVRSMATSLILLEYLQNKSQAAELRDEIAAAFFAGIVAAQLSQEGPIEAEEARICAMFHNLGRVLAVFYLFDESQQIARIMAEQKTSEENASLHVLGLTYSDLGTGIAKSWNFPDQLLAGMRKLPDGKIRKPRSDIDRLCVAVNLANDLCSVAAITKPQDKEQSLNQLCELYEDALDISKPMLANALETGLQELSKRSGILGVNMAKSPLLAKIQKWSGHVESAKKPAPADAGSLKGVVLLDAATGGDNEENDGAISRQDPEAMLEAGIQDVTNTLVEEFELNDVLQMVLETMHRSLDFRNTLIFIRDNRLEMMVARFGFGQTVDAIIPKLRFSLTFAPDVFHLAIDQGVDIVIEDVHAGNIADKIPSWFRNVADAPCFLLLPIMVNKKALGLIYADMKDANSLQMTQRQLALLRTLRNQVIIAIKQKF